MNIKPVSPQDVSWSRDVPVYRVYFWKRPPLPASAPDGVTEDRLVWTAFEYELTECLNVREALAWADENAGHDRSYTLYAVSDRAGERGLIRLFGIDPTKHKGDRKLDWPGQVYF
ncbi:MAG TPA: hypothetical protein VFK17_06315 [Gaiellaceae bacterium]|nr:hypothetical protein [Gaiellaceae bacterium]